MCQPGNTDAACGYPGSQCATCSPDAACYYGTCENSKCTPASCPTGCCDGNGACQPGNQTEDCGTGGAACTQCYYYYGLSEQCQAGQCVMTTCNEYTCSGCCDTSGVCQPGTTASACGEYGSACKACASTAACFSGQCTGFVCDAQTCPDGCCDTSGTCQSVVNMGGAACPCAAICEAGCCDSTGACRAGTTDIACGSGGATCVDCATLGETCDIYTYPYSCDQTCPSAYAGCPSGTTTATAQSLPDACGAGDLADAADACEGGAATTDCETFFQGEYYSNSKCAECLAQFDVDFVDLTGIYACASGFVSCTCNGDTGCAANCTGTVCEMCSGDQTTCETTAQSTVCASVIQSANSCIAASSEAEALCSQSSYANFGAWFAAVGQAYCQKGVTPVCQ